MTTLSTHDTKRSDDVRARLLVLTECADDFADALRRWSTLNAKHRGERVDRGTEWFLYQTLVGAWPISAERLRTYMQKAMREAKLQTSWVSNNSEYEDALNKFIDAVLADSEFVADLGSFVSLVQRAGQINSLSQTLVKYTAPGVPDLYQGGELWDLSLVDPDNRRPVDYALRRRLLAELSALNAAQVTARMDEGLPKLWVIHHSLRLRGEQPAWFGAEAAYTPLAATGEASDRVIAYLRGEHVLTIVPRWNHAAKPWGDTALELPEGQWRNRMTGVQAAGGQVLVDNLLSDFPVALLESI